MTIKPGKYNPLKPDIELFDYKSKKRYGLKLDGSGALQVGTVSQDDTVHIRTAGKRIGDFDEQRSWNGGRGIENLSDNAAGFWDSQNAWTMTDGHVHQTLLWEFSKGLRSCFFNMPSRTRSLAWRQLFGTTRFIASYFTIDSSFSADYVRMWVRRVGRPGTLTVEICANNSGVPGTVAATSTTIRGDFIDVLSILKKFDWTSTTPVVNGTIYHIKIYGASTDNKVNHWEVGGYDGGTLNNYSSDGTSWANGTFTPYYYLANADTARTFFAFFLDGAMYVVDKKDDQTTASQLWINGDRGVTSSATGTTLVASKSWTTDVWAGAYVKIVRGTGVGQTRRITSNTANTLTVPTWDKNPDTTSEFIIYGTSIFTEISTTGLGVVTSTPIVANRIVYFPQGATTIRQMVFNATTGAHAFSNDGSNTAYCMTTSTDKEGLKIWGLSFTAEYATAQAYSVTPTASVFSQITVGGTEYPGTSIAEKDGLIYVFKDSGIWTISLISSATATATAQYAVVKLQTGMEKTPYFSNGVSVFAHQQFLYYSWLHSLIRVYGSSHDDIGQDWSSRGLPDGREGYFSAMDGYTSLLIAAVDAGTGTSSVLGFDGIGWHELLRSFDSNLRCRFVKVQPCEGTRNRMWTDVGGDLIYQEMPLQKSSPRLDSGARYMHESVIESAAIDMGTASGLPKFIKELTVYVENLGGSNEISIDYQVDDDVHTANWIEATTLFQSPEATAYLGLSNIRKFAYRLRINSSDNTSPVDVLGVVPNGYARIPYKMIWTLRCRADNITSRGRLVKPDEMMRWLLDNARFPGRVEMQSQYELAHKFFVVIHPPRMFPYKPAQNGQAEESVFTIVLEEL